MKNEIKLALTEIALNEPLMQWIAVCWLQLIIPVTHALAILGV